MDGIAGRVIVKTMTGETRTFGVCFDDRALVLYATIEKITGFQMKVQNKKPKPLLKIQNT